MLPTEFETVNCWALKVAGKAAPFAICNLYRRTENEERCAENSSCIVLGGQKQNARKNAEIIITRIPISIGNNEKGKCERSARSHEYFWLTNEFKCCRVDRNDII